MRLVVVSHTPHYSHGDSYVGWGPTVRELDHLATRFDIVRHVACLYEEPPPRSALPYSASNVELVPVPPAGADGFLGKLDVLRMSATYVRAIRQELETADVVHVRAPANIALIAIMILLARKKPKARWFKYAGNWQPSAPESPSYTFQRWLLARSAHHGIVTINGEWPSQPTWVRTFYNPSLEQSEIDLGRRIGESKLLSGSLRLLFVGNLISSKGAGRALEILREVRVRGVDAFLEVIGDGEQRAQFERIAHELGIEANVKFWGWQEPRLVHEAYGRAHVQLLPSSSEGWPKVLSEGMAYGVVPLAGAVSSIPHYLAKFATGAALPPDDIHAFATAIEGYVTNPDRWQRESRNALGAAQLFSFNHYLEAVDALLHETAA